MPSTSPRTLSSSWRFTWLAAAAVVMGMPSHSLAQCQAEWRYVNGDTHVVDGSTPTPGGLAWVNSVPCVQGPNCVEYVPVGNVVYHQLIAEGSYTFKAQLSPYFTAEGGSASCTRDSSNCLHCGGGFSLPLLSRQGLIEGRVYRLPLFEPIGGAQVVAKSQGGIYYDATDPAGFFSYRPSGTSNNWGLPLNATPGPRSYLVNIFGGKPANDVPATIDSNTLAYVVILYPESYMEEPPRCSSGQPPETGPGPTAGSAAPPCESSSPTPPPCQVGKPVSVTTGNVDLDQTDASIPGLGLGLRFMRSYNSHNVAAGRYGLFGRGWTHSYEKRLTFPAAKIIMLRTGSGQPSYFQDRDNNNQFLASVPFTNESWIEKQSATVYVRHFRRGGSERYEVLTSGTASLTSLTDVAGNVTTLGYVSGKLTTITDPGGRQLTLTYTGSQIQQLSGLNGPIATFTYIALGGSLGSALRTVTYADGDGDGQPDGSYTFAYHPSPSGRLWTVTDGAGVVLETHLYDSTGRAVETKVSGDVEKYLLDYSQPGKTVVTDSLGNATTYEWANVWGAQRLTRITGPCAGCGGGGDVQEWTYDFNGRITSYKDGEGDVTTYDYVGDETNADGNIRSVTAPAPAPGAPAPLTTYTYYPDGRTHTRTEPNGRVTTWTYVAAGPATLTETVSAGVTRTTTITYTSQGKPWTIIDPMGRTTEMHYTAQGDLEWTRDPLLHQTSFEYDAMGRKEKTILPPTTPSTDAPRISYDARGRAWRHMNPNGSYWRHWYDGGGRRIRTRAPLSFETEYQHDSYGRLWRIVDARDGVTEYQYDAMSNLQSLTDPNSQQTTFTYDGHHRVAKITYPTATSPAPFEEFTYDRTGRLKTRRDRESVTTTFVYDGRGRLTYKTYSDGSPPVSFGYDANGDVGFRTSASNSGDSLSWDYDLVGQVLSEASTRNGTNIASVYDLSGRRIKQRLNGTDVLTYAYDADGELDTITRAPGVVFDLDRDAVHRREDIAFPNGTSTEYGYDSLSRLSLIRLRRLATLLNEVTYESNDLDNRTARTENGTRMEYGYDEFSRLLTADRSQPLPAARQEEYSYDPVGNRLTALGVPGLWSYNERNELLSYNGLTLGYDINGNLTSRSGSPARTYVWDVENQLASASDNGVAMASFEYDPLGRRVAKATSAGLTRFAYDGQDILLEQGPSGTFTYLHGPGVDEPLAREAADGSRTYYHADGLGSIITQTDASGVAISARTYEAFGQTSPGGPSGYAFTGRESDPEIGLYYYRARYYDPGLGRFISADPIRMAGGLNVYTYVENNPTLLSDPFGLIPRPRPRYFDTGCNPTQWINCLIKCGGRANVDWCIEGWMVDFRQGPTNVKDGGWIPTDPISLGESCLCKRTPGDGLKLIPGGKATVCPIVIIDPCLVAPTMCCNGQFVGLGGCAVTGGT